MDIADLRVALFSGNYNYVRDGANQALNRLSGYLLRQGAQVRVYTPVVERPAFEATGDMVGLPSLPIPLRAEYRMPMGLPPAARCDLEAFAPNVVHVTSPDPSGHKAIDWAERHRLPVLASVHTRFETYFRYYRMAFMEPWIVRLMRRFYQRCDALVAPSKSMAEVLRAQGMNADIGLWERGVDRTIFDPSRRDPAWRRQHGIGDGDVAIGFLGRLVMEKGLDVFSAALAELRRRGVAHKVLVIGEGPAREWFAQRQPGAVFAGFQQGADLGRAVASMDVLLNPSVTETFGNVTLEAMASGLPVVAARATGSTSLVVDGETGMLIEPGNSQAFADALQRYVEDPAERTTHGAAGEQRSRSYDWDSVNSAVAETYLRLIKTRRSG